MNNILATTPHHPRGVPFTPLGLSTQSTEEIERALAKTDCSHLEAHCRDATVLVSEAYAVSSLLADANRHGGQAFIIGFAAGDYVRIADRPVPSIFSQLEADAQAAAKDPSYQPRFLAPQQLAGFLEDGLAGRLDPADYAHRVPEIQVIVENTPVGKTSPKTRDFLRSAEAYAGGPERRGARQFVQVYTTNAAMQTHGDEDLEIIVLACPSADRENELGMTQPISPSRPDPSGALSGQMDLSI